MKSTTDQIYAIQSTNLTTQRVVLEQERFTLKDATAVLETANNTEDAWFYEMVIPEDEEQKAQRLR